ncbi:Transcriptional regulatory protein LiaR [Streptomyces sp. YIM 130001]|uniref:response regulator transcription factor n=1 Tax=Streptomyces sp. YIM 130001 TaxID=2259644 RepID=UPI000E65833C|nr:response regulator transcription factor [Streptomyces sp. YIM 130001]RII14002.1 Transcriptional regulatory protein LiaR [Streptomyces sp. YIM 130001]
MIKLVLVDDEWLVRAGLTTMLSGFEDLTVVGEAADGHTAVEVVSRTRPDVVLMDVRMPRVDGLTATAALRSAPAPPAPPEVVMLTTFGADHLVLGALRAGAAGFLLKDTPPAQLVEGIRAVAAGDPILSPAVTRGLIDRALDDSGERRDDSRRRLAVLAPGERRVAEAIGTGASNVEIAADLHMTVATVKTYTSRILTKLDYNNRVQIALLVHDSH